MIHICASVCMMYHRLGPALGEEHVHFVKELWRMHVSTRSGGGRVQVIHTIAAGLCRFVCACTVK